MNPYEDEYFLSMAIVTAGLVTFMFCAGVVYFAFEMGGWLGVAGLVGLVIAYGLAVVGVRRCLRSRLGGQRK